MDDKPISIEIEDAWMDVGTLCRACHGTGYNAQTPALYNSFGGLDGWGHHLELPEVLALVEAGRLFELTHRYVEGSAARWEWIEPRIVPSVDEVNRWSYVGFGHDLINRRIAVETRAGLAGVFGACGRCANGEIIH
jgi:hypothetical protein